MSYLFLERNCQKFLCTSFNIINLLLYSNVYWEKITSFFPMKEKPKVCIYKPNIYLNFRALGLMHVTYWTLLSLISWTFSCHFLLVTPLNTHHNSCISSISHYIFSSCIFINYRYCSLIQGKLMSLIVEDRLLWLLSREPTKQYVNLRFCWM